MPETSEKEKSLRIVVEFLKTPGKWNLGFESDSRDEGAVAKRITALLTDEKFQGREVQLSGGPLGRGKYYALFTVPIGSQKFYLLGEGESETGAIIGAAKKFIQNPRAMEPFRN